MKDFELISHTADLQIRVYGKTISELFRNSLIGMFQSIVPKNNKCEYQDNRVACAELPEEHYIEISAVDREMLLVDFLSEALYLSDVNNEAYLDIVIHKISDNNITATLRGIKVEGFEVVEIKAVTYHDLKVKFEDGLWQANIVFDI